MKRKLIPVALCVAVVLVAVAANGKEKKPKPGKLTGTWDCISHGGSQGDMPFTLSLEQNGETVTGSVDSPIGGTDITSATFKKKTLEIHIDTPQANYLLTAKLKKKTLNGEWSNDREKGAWEGKLKAAAATP